MTVNTLFSLLHSKERPIHKEETIYSNWMDTMVTICDEITTESLVSFFFFFFPGNDVCVKHVFSLVRITPNPPYQAVSDEAAKVIYQMKRATSTRDKESDTTQSGEKILRDKDRT